MNRKIKYLIIIGFVFIIIFGTLTFSNITGGKKPKYETFEYSTLLPDVEDMDIEIVNQDGGEKYAFKVLDIEDQYYYDYCLSLRDHNFSDVRYETQSSFGAYTEDGKYWIEAHYYNDDKNMLVIVQESKNYNK